MGADYLIADNELAGSGDDWSFSYVCDVEIVKNANVKEKSVDLDRKNRSRSYEDSMRSKREYRFSTDRR